MLELRRRVHGVTSRYSWFYGPVSGHFRRYSHFVTRPKVMIMAAPAPSPAALPHSAAKSSHSEDR